MSEHLLAVDLGGGSLRAAAVSLRGAVDASLAVPLAFDEPFVGWSEADPALWWEALGRAVAGVLAALPHARIAGLCIAGMTRSQVVLDKRRRVLRPAILWRDRRAEAEVPLVARAFPKLADATAISAFHPLARLAWIARHEPATFARIAYVLEPKDYLNLRLSGVIAADSVTYSRYDDLALEERQPGWLAAAFGLLAPRQRHDPWAQIGTIDCAAAPFDQLAGVPVFCGVMDTWAAAVGSGATRAGLGYDVAGTSEAVGLVSARRAMASGLVTLRWTDRLFQLGGPTQAGADSARWCHDVFRVEGSLGEAIERAGARAPAHDLPLLLPYLAGERAPVWRGDVRGGFVGVSRSHDADAFLWATLEGVAHTVRDILDLACTASDQQLHEVRVSGGGARSAAWCRLKANLLGVPLARAAQDETGVIGAAMAAAVGLGAYRDLAAAADAMAAVDEVFEPSRPLRTFFEDRVALYRAVKAQALALTDRPRPLPPTQEQPDEGPVRARVR